MREIICYEITNSGKGERGRTVEVHGNQTDPRWCAEYAADYFDAIGKRRYGYTDYDLDASRRVIEVTGFGGGPKRFIVRTRVKRCYESEEMT